MRLKTYLLAAAATTTAFTAMPALAQGPVTEERGEGTITGTTGAGRDQSGGIPDILVTARKVEERLQDAPVAVSVVSSAMIEELGLDNLNDFAQQATGVSFSQAFGRSTDRPVIRGQSNVLAGVQAGVETGAAFFIDGIYYQGDIQGFDPQAIERVEVIKGPQSALYGRNTYAGAINYVTKDPTSVFSGSGRARAAQHNEYEIAGSISGPIIPGVLGFRAGGRFFTYGGEYVNQLTGKKVGQEESTSAYLTLLAEPTPDIRIRPRIMWQRDDDGPLAIFLQGAESNNCFPGFRSPAHRQGNPIFQAYPVTRRSENRNQYFCGVIRPQPNNIRLNTDPIDLGPPLGVRDGTAFDGVFNEQIMISNVLDWDVAGSGWVVSSLTGYRRNKNLFGTDSDHSDAFVYLVPFTPPAALVGVEPAFANTNRDRQRDFSQEVRIASPANLPVRGFLGAYYFRQRFQTVDITFASGPAGLPLGTDLSQYATIDNRAVFGLLAWDITERLTVTGELRYQRERKTLIDRSSATNIFCAGAQDQAGTFGFTGTCLPAGTFSGWDPRLTIDYRTPGGTLFYGVLASGRKPGGFNGTAGVTAAQQTGQQAFIGYLPEKSRGGELGIKADVLDRTLRLAAAVFYNKLSEVQLTSAIPNPTGTGALTSIVTNSGDARNYGLEVEVRAVPTRGLDMSLGVAYVNARFTRGCDADEFILRSGGLRPNFDTRNPPASALPLCDISGRRLPLGSPWQINGSISYDTALSPQSDFTLFTNTNFSFEGSKYVQVHNQARTGETFLLNARVGIRNERFSVALFGRNLTNEDTIPLATRWFDLRYGTGTRNLPAGVGNPPALTFDGRPAQIETGSPRGFFGTLRKGRTVGVEATFRF
ncbi:MAG: TonB-dependent receptor [Allosphingosinicella sp.]|uniref:TonB-dependent receptor n=1 Tax=Allosphingosinicella sp. TaxID=2823234 RepID=UPI00395EAD70